MESENLLPKTICYCFGYSLEDIRKDLFSQNGRSNLSGADPERKKGWRM